MERPIDPPTAEQLVAEILDLTVGSGERFAAEVGVSYASLYAWSRGRRHPSRANARALAREASRRARRLAELARSLDDLPRSGRTAGGPGSDPSSLAPPPDIAPLGQPDRPEATA